MVNNNINNFASQCLVFEEKMNYLSLKMHQIGLMSFCMTILTKFSCLNYHTKIHYLNLMHFQEEMGHFFLKNKALRSEIVKHRL